MSRRSIVIISSCLATASAMPLWLTLSGSTAPMHPGHASCSSVLLPKPATNLLLWDVIIARDVSRICDSLHARMDQTTPYLFKYHSEIVNRSAGHTQTHLTFGTYDPSGVYRHNEQRSHRSTPRTRYQVGCSLRVASAARPRASGFVRCGIRNDLLAPYTRTLSEPDRPREIKVHCSGRVDGHAEAVINSSHLKF